MIRSSRPAPWVALLGGTFDPIHLGHLRIAAAALEHPGVAELRLVPALRPPHKVRGAHASFEHRVAMCRIACRETPRVSVWELEGELGCVCYTIDTLDEAAARLAPGIPVFVMGADSLIDLPNWHRPDELLERHALLVVRRPGFNLARVPPTTLSRIQVLEMNETPLSSTLARSVAHRPGNAFVPAGVDRYIHQHQLYGSRASQ